MIREEAARAAANAFRRLIEYGEGVGADEAERDLAAALLVLTAFPHGDELRSNAFASAS